LAVSRAGTVELLQRRQNLIEPDERTVVELAPGRSIGYSASVREPRGKNPAFFIVAERRSGQNNFGRRKQWR
jgi:hypothetical protein